MQTVNFAIAKFAGSSSLIPIVRASLLMGQSKTCDSYMTVKPTRKGKIKMTLLKHGRVMAFPLHHGGPAARLLGHYRALYLVARKAEYQEL